jgi:hypothetical protein
VEPKLDMLNTFIEVKMEHLEKCVHGFNPKKKPRQEQLERGFVKIIENTWPPVFG